MQTNEELREREEWYNSIRPWREESKLFTDKYYQDLLGTGKRFFWWGPVGVHLRKVVAYSGTKYEYIVGISSIVEPEEFLGYKYDDYDFLTVEEVRAFAEVDLDNFLLGIMPKETILEDFPTLCDGVSNK